MASVRPSLANRAHSRVHCRCRPPTALASWSWFSTIHQNREDLLAPWVISRTTPRRPFEFLDIGPGWPHILRTATSPFHSPRTSSQTTAAGRERDSIATPAGRARDTNGTGWVYICTNAPLVLLAPALARLLKTLRRPVLGRRPSPCSHSQTGAQRLRHTHGGANGRERRDRG